MSETIDYSDPALQAELEDIVQEMLDGIVEASIPEAVLPMVGGHDGVTVESCLAIIGDEDRAMLTLRVPAATAIGLTSALVGEDPGELDTDDACETIAELSNVLAGSIKSLLEQETALDVPAAKAFPTDALAPLTTISVSHLLGTFDVHLGN